MSNNVNGQFDTDETEDLDLMEVRAGDKPVGWAGITRPDGRVYLGGDIHPLGSALAMLKAAKEHVPYVAVSAVRVMFPAEWLRAECMHDADRLRIIDNLSSWVRSQ